MRLLVVEGNTSEIWQARQAKGGVPYHKRFLAMLKMLCPEAEVSVVFPADGTAGLPATRQLQKYDGVLWTGSSLYINDPIPGVERQLSFAEEVFASGVPVYGSCWGLQVAVVVAGGKVGTCAKGREFGVTTPIQLTAAGEKHIAFRGRKKPFPALCIHLDETLKLPDGATVLACNDHSEVQALTLQYKKSAFFGVQYHPEFTCADVAFIARYMADTLLREGVFESHENSEAFAKQMDEAAGLPEAITNYAIHTQEIGNWLTSIKR